MEVAKNIFKDGLVCDLAPESTGSSSLSYMLNGTLLTYNGNEFSLQNDMGNVKIEDAHLPEGFIPVGAKEHGGIIYVASYNPETKECLLGSFPSPEVEITSDEGELPVTDVKLNKYFEDPVTQYKDILAEYTLYPGDSYEIEFDNTSVFKDSKELIHYQLALFTKTNVVIEIPLELDENNKVSGVIDKKFSGKITLLSQFKMPKDFIINVSKEGEILTVNKSLKDFSGNIIENVHTTNEANQELFIKTTEGFKNNSGLIIGNLIEYTPMIPVPFEVLNYDDFIKFNNINYYAIPLLKKIINLNAIYENTGIQIDTWKYLYDNGIITLDCAFNSSDLITDVVLNFFPQVFGQDCNFTELEFSIKLENVYGNYHKQNINFSDLSHELYLVKIIINKKHYLYRWVFNNDWFNEYYNNESSDYLNYFLPNKEGILYEQFGTELSSNNGLIKSISDLTSELSDYYTRNDTLKIILILENILADLGANVDAKTNNGEITIEYAGNSDQGISSVSIINEILLTDSRKASKTTKEASVAVYSENFSTRFGIMCIGSSNGKKIPLMLVFEGTSYGAKEVNNLVYDDFPIFPIFINSDCTIAYKNEEYNLGVYLGLIANISGEYSLISELIKIEEIELSIISDKQTDIYTQSFVYNGNTMGYYNSDILKILETNAQNALNKYKIYEYDRTTTKSDVPVINFEELPKNDYIDGSIELTFNNYIMLENIPNEIGANNLKTNNVTYNFNYTLETIKEENKTTYNIITDNDSSSQDYELENLTSNKIIYLNNKYITIPNKYIIPSNVAVDPNNTVKFIVETPNSLLYGSINTPIEFTPEQLNVGYDSSYAINFSNHFNLNLPNYVPNES